MSKYFLFIIILVCNSSFVFAQLNSRELVAYWPFNGNANDESGNSHDGKVYGAKLTTDRFGDKNKAYLFDGIDDYIFVESSGKMNNISEYLSISAWFKPKDRYYNTIVAKGSHNFLMQLTKHLRPGILLKGLTIDYEGSENYWGRILLHEQVPENEWTHFVCTYDKSNGLVSLYINGSLKHQSIASGNIQSGSENLRIGARIDETYTEYFDGILDDVLIYSRSINQDEINYLYSEDYEIDEDFVLFPNPASSELNFKTNIKDLSEIQIYDVAGQRVYTGPFQTKLNIRFLASGLYLFRIKNPSESEVFVKKVVVKRSRIKYH